MVKFKCYKINFTFVTSLRKAKIKPNLKKIPQFRLYVHPIQELFVLLLPASNIYEWDRVRRPVLCLAVFSFEVAMVHLRAKLQIVFLEDFG